MLLLIGDLRWSWEDYATKIAFVVTGILVLWQSAKCPSLTTLIFENQLFSSQDIKLNVLWAYWLPALISRIYNITALSSNNSLQSVSSFYALSWQFGAYSLEIQGFLFRTCGVSINFAAKPANISPGSDTRVPSFCLVLHVCLSITHHTCNLSLINSTFKTQNSEVSVASYPNKISSGFIFQTKKDNVRLTLFKNID